MKLLKARGGLLLTGILALLLSCEKANKPLQTGEQPTTTVQISQADKTERMIQFLSITLNVPKEKIVYKTQTQEFVILGTLKFSYTETEVRYNEANEYKRIYKLPKD